MLTILKEIRIYIFLGILALIGGSTLFALDQYIMPVYTNYSNGITVPDVTHLSYDEARNVLISKGFRYEIIAERTHESFPPNYVTDQSPAPETIVKPNRKVYLTINTTGRPLVVVPNVINLSLRNAEIQLQNYGLRIGNVSYASSRFKNSVLEQSLRPGASVDRGMVVDLVVSDGLGSRKVELPDIRGKRLAEAQQQLRLNGLRIGSIRFEVTRTVEPNIVMDYSPKDTQVFEGTSIDIVVSEAPDRVEESEAAAVIDTDTEQREMRETGNDPEVEPDEDIEP